MTLLSRLLPLRTQSLSHRFYASPPRTIKDRGEYFETRKNPGWWKRQDFDDKMTYVVTVMAIAAIYWAYSTTNIYRGPGPDPYGDELLRIERLAKEQEEREISEYGPNSDKTGQR